MFFENHRRGVYQIRKTITNLDKSIEIRNIILQIQELSLNPEKYFANPKKYFVTCYLRQQSASVRVVCRIQNGGGALAGVGRVCNRL